VLSAVASPHSLSLIVIDTLTINYLLTLIDDDSTAAQQDVIIVARRRRHCSQSSTIATAA
jgi:hypothetical protein